MPTSTGISFLITNPSTTTAIIIFPKNNYQGKILTYKKNTYHSIDQRLNRGQTSLKWCWKKIKALCNHGV